MNHWYDGVFFDLFVAPNQDPIFRAIGGAIPDGSTVLDVGCGTGRLAFQLADRARHIRAIDPSARNIRRALAVHAGRGTPPNVEFEQASLDEHVRRSRGRYDIGVLSYVIHEVPAQERVSMLRSLVRVAEMVVLADYRVPRPRGLMDVATEVVEWAAGREHYSGFRSFVRGGGLTGLIREAGLRVRGDAECSVRNAQVILVDGGA